VKVKETVKKTITIIFKYDWESTKKSKAILPTLLSIFSCDAIYYYLILGWFKFFKNTESGMMSRE
jgi:hypothetical protein